MVARLPVRPGSDEVGHEAMESSLKDETKASGSLLNHAKVEPLIVLVKALHLTGS